MISPLHNAHARKHVSTGFTIIELLVVIVLIGILTTVSIVSYNGTRQKANGSVASTDLHNASTQIELAYAKTGEYPASMPADTKTSPGIIMQLSSTGVSSAYCINAFSTVDSTVRMSWDSGKGGLNNSPCSGAFIGSSVGGVMPLAPRSQNIMSDFSRWSLMSGATYDTNTKELSLLPSGYIVSPIVRVDSARIISVGGDMFAASASLNLTVAPMAAYHTSISYFGSDGITPATNSANYTSNGCAKKFTVGTWTIADKQCVYLGGPNVIYIAFSFSGSNGGYASPDLKIKNPLLIVID